MGQILLVRHGQASWDGEDYDVLSELGHRQGRLLGTALAARRIRPDLVVSGGMRRHRETVENVVEGAGFGDVTVQVDPGWDEYDHVSMLAQVPTPFVGLKPSAAEFQDWMEQATERWVRGDNPKDYREPFDTFTARVDEALRRTAEVAAGGTVLVVTSGGPVSWVTAAQLGGGTATWRRLNIVCVNSGVTKLIAGRRGLTLVSFNEHTHLEGEPDLLTYR